MNLAVGLCVNGVFYTIHECFISLFTIFRSASLFNVFRNWSQNRHGLESVHPKGGVPCSSGRYTGSNSKSRKIDRRLGERVIFVSTPTESVIINSFWKDRLRRRRSRIWRWVRFFRRFLLSSLFVMDKFSIDTWWRLDNWKSIYHSALQNLFCFEPSTMIRKRPRYNACNTHLVYL